MLQGVEVTDSLIEKAVLSGLTAEDLLRGESVDSKTRQNVEQRFAAVGGQVKKKQAEEEQRQLDTYSRSVMLPDSTASRQLMALSGGLTKKAGALVARPFSSDTADVLLRETQELEEATRARDIAEHGKTAARVLGWVRGAADSVVTAVALSPLGVPGIIGGFSLFEGNSALTEAEDAGLKGADRLKFAGRAALIEGGVTAAFSLVGMGGLEKMIGGGGGVTRAGLKPFLKEVGKNLGHEIPEEIITEIAHNANRAISNVDPNALDRQVVLDTVIDTTMQTLLAVGFTGSVQGIKAQSVLKDRQPMADALVRQWGFSEDTAMKIIARTAQAKGDFSVALGQEIDRERIKTPAGIIEWISRRPEEAKALAKDGDTSRKAFSQIGLPRMSRKERTVFVGDVQELIDDALASAPEIEPEVAAAEEDETQEEGEHGREDEESEGGGVETAREEPPSDEDDTGRSVEVGGPSVRQDDTARGEEQEQGDRDVEPDVSATEPVDLDSGKEPGVQAEAVGVARREPDSGDRRPLPDSGDDKVVSDATKRSDDAAEPTESPVVEPTHPGVDIARASEEDLEALILSEVEEEVAQAGGEQVLKKTGKKVSAKTLSEKAAGARQEFSDVMVELDDYLVGKAFSAPLADPKLWGIVAKATAKGIKAGVYSFADLIAQTSKSIGAARTKKLLPVFERAWEKLHKIDTSGKLSPVEAVDKILEQEEPAVAEKTETYEVTGNYDLREKAPVVLTKGARKKVNANVKEILKKETLSDQDKEELRQYTGEGGLSPGTQEALNQHFTDYDTIRAMFRALEEAGVPMDKMLEPAVGAGSFVGNRPEADWTTVDIDATNHAVVKALYPKAKHYHVSFEKFISTDFDVSISNVPFLETRGAEKTRKDIKNLHDFFFVHALDRVKPNGIVAFITSRFTMDKANRKIREEIVSKADVIGAYRLPGGHFAQTAHTDVTTDIIFLQRRPDNVSPRPENASRNLFFLFSEETEDGVYLNDWYKKHPNAVLGSMVLGKDKMYGKPAYEVHGPARLDEIAIDYRPYDIPETATEKGGKAKGEEAKAEEGPPSFFRDFPEWVATNNVMARLSDNPAYYRDIDVIEGTVYEAHKEIGFADINQTAKLYKPVKGKIADKIIALDKIAQQATAYQAGDELAAERGLAAIAAYQKKFKVAPVKDKELRAFFKKHQENTFFSELSSSFDENFIPASVFSERTRYSDSGRMRAREDDSALKQAIAAEDNTGTVHFPTADGLITMEDVPDLLESQYALAGWEDGKPVLQNNILYYGGNIYKKLGKIRAMHAMADVPVEYHKTLNRQIEQLEGIKPELKQLADIHFKCSEKWLLPTMRRIGVDVDSKISQETGIKEYSFYWNMLTHGENRIVTRTMNNLPLVKREKEEGLAPYMMRVQEAQDQLQEVYGKIKNAIASDDDLRVQVEGMYNSRFRNYVKPKYEEATYLIQDVLDEIVQNNPTMRDPKTGNKVPLHLRRNQISWAVQALYEGRGINAHDVGGGKTMSAILLARVLKRRGQAQKPIFCVPARTIKKWVQETKLLFPDAKIIDLGALPKDKREKALFDLANANADFVFISHEGFGKIKLPAKDEAQYVRDIIAEHIDDPDVSGRQEAVNAERAKAYIAAIESSNRDTRLTWDKLGIDCIICDEAHNFKNIGISGRLSAFKLGKRMAFKEKGSIDSARSYDFRFKANYVSDNNNDNNIFLLTATPTPNAPMEVYTMLRHLGRNVFDNYGIENDRDFASTFLQLGTAQDRIKGEARNILRNIVNAQELRGLLDRFVDKMNMEQMPWIVVPDIAEQQVYVKPSEGYRIARADMTSRRLNLPHPAYKGDDTLMAIFSTGRSAAVDPRLYGGEHAGVEIEFRSYDVEDDKVEWTINHVMEVATENKRAGQLIFVDEVGHTAKGAGRMPEDIHAEIKRALIERGFKPHQVAIINGKQITSLAKNNYGRETGLGSTAAQKKADLQEAYNEGVIKVILGTTQSMGEGMDLQVKTTDIYHLDIPYKPGDFRQRNGRGIRPGNENDQVNIHYLMMRGSFDSISMGIVQTKRGWNEAIWDKEVADTISTEEEMTSGAIPNDKQILIELEEDPLKQEILKIEYKGESLRDELGNLHNSRTSTTFRLRSLGRDLATFEEAEIKRKKTLAELKPNEKIKDAKKRQEAFEKSKAYAEKMLISVQKRIKDTKETLARMEIKEAQLVDQFETVQETLKAHFAKYYDEHGEVIFTQEDLDQKIRKEVDSGEAMDFPTSSMEGVTVARQKKAEIKPSKLIQSADIISTIQKLWPELSIRGKATFKKKARGWYSRVLAEMRLVDRRDIDAALHELGHHFDNQLNMWSKSHNLPKGIPAELMKLGKALYGDKRPPIGYKAEGFAEFIREYLTGSPTIQREAPNLYEWFAQYLSKKPKEAKRIRDLENLVFRLRTRTPEQVVRAFRQPLKRDWSRERISSIVAATETAHIDKNLPLLRAMQAAGISDLRPGDDPYVLATAYSRSAGGRALYSALNGTYDLAGNKTGEGLRQALEPIFTQGKETLEEWTDYAIACRALDLHRREINPGIEKKVAQAVVDKYGSVEFDQALQAVTDWSRRQLDLLVESGMMTMQEFQKIVELNPVYVPFARQFLESEKSKGRKRKGGRPVYRIKGSGLEIHNPIDALVMQAEKIIQSAMEADVARAMVRLYDKRKGTGPLGKLMSEVPAPLEATVFTAERIKKDMAEKAVELGADPERVAAAMLDTWDETMTVFTKAAQYKGKDNIISLVIDGKRRFFEVNESIKNILEGLNKTRILPGKLGEISRQLVGLQRLGATGLNPAFGLLRNPLRDTMTAAITSQYHFHIPVISLFRGVIKDIVNTDEAQLFHALGVDIAGYYGQDIRLAKKTGRRVTAKSRAGKIMAGGLVSGVRDILSHSEVGPRLMEFEAAQMYGMKKYGSARDANLLAVCAAKDVTVNFSRAGSTGQALNELILFYNAAVQSIEKLSRAAGLLEAAPWEKDKSRRSRMMRTAARGVGFLTLTSLALYFANRDKEWWKELPDYEKWSYMHIDFGGGRVLRLPLPFEAGSFFGSLPVAIIEEQRNPGAFYEAVVQFAKNALPISVEGENAREIAHSLARNVAGLAPMIDIIANRDWRGSHIISPSMEKYREKQDQYTPYTTEFTKLLAQWGVPMSPARMDHVLNGYTGGLYRRLAMGLETVLDPASIFINGDPSTIPLLGTLWLRSGASRLASDFYDRLDYLRQKKGSGTAVLTELGELKTGTALERELSGLWAERRVGKEKLSPGEAKKLGDSIVEETHKKLRAHNARQDFEQAGSMGLVYEATDPSATDKEKALAVKLLAGQDAGRLLRLAVQARGGEIRARHKNMKLTAYGKRQQRLRSLFMNHSTAVE